MGLLDGGKSEQLKYLEDERKKLWASVVALENSLHSLEKELKTGTPEVVKEAKENSKKAAEYRNRTELRLNEAEEIFKKISAELTAIQIAKTETENLNIVSRNKFSEIDKIWIDAEELSAQLRTKVELLEDKSTTLASIFENYPNLDGELIKLDEFVKKVEENQKKSILSLNSINSRKTEIDDLYREIFGYTEENDDGEEVVIDGVKEELTKSYNEIKTGLDESLEELGKLNSTYQNKFGEFEKKHIDKYSSIIEEIRQLLPNALTAGLSSAFSQKKDDEVKSSISLQSKFTLGIYLLIGASMLPVIVSVVFLFQDISLEEVINRLPRLVMAIVPMYIPLIWLTHSASKKLNLSKRLIEEYSHKEVLSRTYEGLSSQIESIGDKGQSEELRIRLLTNFLQVTSENPGKLISNYETSDHPLIEALEQSYKFQIALDKLGGIPGVGKVVAILEKRSNKKLQDKANKIEESLGNETL